MNINSETVLNRTNAKDDIGQMRIVETESGLVFKFHITPLEQFVCDFSNFAVKTAQSTLEMCRVVHEAKQTLKKEDFLKFCNQIGHQSEDSTIRKYLAIGEKYKDLIAHADLLPNSWTSIYKITQIPSEAFDALVLSGNTMATMNGKQIDALKAIGTTKQSVTASNQKTQSSIAPSASTTSITTNVNSNAEIDIDADADADVDDSFLMNDQSEKTDSTTKCHNDVAENKSDKSDVYQILIRFKCEPSDDDWWNLTEELDSIIAKHNLNVDVIEL